MGPRPNSSEKERKMFYLTTHSTHFVYGYMASDIWLRTILIVIKETRCRHIGYSYRLTARVLLYAPSHRQDNTYHGLCYTSRGALPRTRNSTYHGLCYTSREALAGTRKCSMKPILITLPLFNVAMPTVAGTRLMPGRYPPGRGRQDRSPLP